MNKKVVVFSQLDQDILQRLQQQYQVVIINPKQGDVNQQILEQVKDADAMIGAGRLLNENNLATAQQLKIISSVSVGYDNYDLSYLNQQKIWLSNTPHVLTESTADLAFSLLMSAARKVPHAVFVNIARGSVVDEPALINTLKAGKIFAAGLDVYVKEPLQESELFALENVVTMPHVGSATAETRKKMAELAYCNLVDVLEGRTPPYLVNPAFA